MSNLKAMSFAFRKDTVDMIMAGKGGHIGGDMSVMDILIELYFEQMNISPEKADDPDRDRFVMSKGHSVEALYTVLAHKGFFPIEEVIEKLNLTNRQKEVLALRYYKGYGIKAIATYYDVSHQSVAKILKQIQTKYNSYLESTK